MSSVLNMKIIRITSYLLTIVRRKSVLYKGCLSINLGLSCNQPKFSPNASWNPNATTFANSSVVGYNLYAIFVDTNNTVFATDGQNGRIIIWRNGSTSRTTNITTSLSYPYSLFVSSDDAIFVVNDYSNHQVDRWTLNGTRLPSPMTSCHQCSGLFVDINNNLYCSQYAFNQVVRTSLSNPDNTLTIVADNGCPGSTLNMLSSPYGIFVTTILDLYVADSGNDRIQLFRRGEERDHSGRQWVSGDHHTF